nr:HAD family hydrolase [Micromonospora purpureochromogenes]
MDVVLFDKIGTLTMGDHAVTGPAGGTSEEEVLCLAAGVEAESEHPLAARTIDQAAKGRGHHQAATPVGRTENRHDHRRCSAGRRGGRRAPGIRHSVDEVLAEVPPADKNDKITKLQSLGLSACLRRSGMDGVAA